MRLLSDPQFLDGLRRRETVLRRIAGVLSPRKTTDLWLAKAILDLLGPAALTSDPVLGAIGGIAEAQQRRGIVEQHPGGTASVSGLSSLAGLASVRRAQQAGRLGGKAMARKTPPAAQPVEA